LTKVTDLDTIKGLVAKISGRDDVQVNDTALKAIVEATGGSLGDILDLVEETLRDQKMLSLETIKKQLISMTFE
jgi:DNA polymerase III gamma/tau subunit